MYTFIYSVILLPVYKVVNLQLFYILHFHFSFYRGNTSAKTIKLHQKKIVSLRAKKYWKQTTFCGVRNDYTNMNGYANILEFQTWIVYQRVAIDCASCLCKYFSLFFFFSIIYYFLFVILIDRRILSQRTKNFHINY